MHAKDAILYTYGMNDRILGAYLGDLSDADLLVRPVAGQNHIAWQLGHLINTERNLIEGVRPGTCPPLPEGFEQAHARDADATASDDASKFLPKERYLELFQAQRAATKKVLEGLSDADLATPAPERTQRIAPTVGALMALVGNHLLMHVGQFVSVRRKLGKPVAI